MRSKPGGSRYSGTSLADLEGNLYKLWNRLASGSYFPPPVLRVEIPKGDGRMRPLGIPTVADRVARTVVKTYLEPELEKHFHPDSYGYRSGKSALDAVGMARQRCWRSDWVLDLDIKGFFDRLNMDSGGLAELTGEVECDEAYVIAGHKGNPAAVRKKGRKGRRNRLKGARGRGTLEKEKPPVFGMIERSGEVVIQMLANVKQATTAPLIQATIMPGSTVFTDEYNIYNRLSEWGYEHKTVNHNQGEYARDEDGDGFHEVHVNTKVLSGNFRAFRVFRSSKKMYRVLLNR